MSNASNKADDADNENENDEHDDNDDNDDDEDDNDDAVEEARAQTTPIPKTASSQVNLNFFIGFFL